MRNAALPPSRPAGHRKQVVGPILPPLEIRELSSVGQVLARSCQSSSELRRLWEGAEQLSINPQPMSLGQRTWTVLLQRNPDDGCEFCGGIEAADSKSRQLACGRLMACGNRVSCVDGDCCRARPLRR